MGFINQLTTGGPHIVWIGCGILESIAVDSVREEYLEPSGTSQSLEDLESYCRQ